ncbi:MAG TPA: flavodoxin family protein [Sedimentisphaerales bacterium]|nr:flavodoxin family protein [Sedimentisphaerales bacterium]
MAVKVLGISASPRIEGNSDLLLRQALAGAESAGAQTEYIRLCELNIAPCTECNSCYKTGKCSIEDDYQMLSSKMLQADRLIFATPIFFMTVCAQAKILIDRCQCLWAHKYVLKQPLITAGRDRRAMVIAVGGTKSKKMFDSIRLTMKYYLDVLDMHYTANLFVNKIDSPGRIKQHPSAMSEAFRLGKELVSAAAPPEEPINVELT